MILLINDNMLFCYDVPTKKKSVSIYKLACVPLIIISVIRILCSLRKAQTETRQLAYDTKTHSLNFYLTEKIESKTNL